MKGTIAALTDRKERLTIQTSYYKREENLLGTI